MAKKNLTPEELQAKLEKKSAKRKVFFGTFTKALAVFLAIVIAWSLVVISFTAPSLGSANTGAVSNNGGVTNNGGATNTDDDNLLGGGDDNLLGDDTTPGDDATVPGDDATVPGDDATPGDDAQKPAGATKADVIKLFNDVTAKAAKGSYKLTRTGKFTKPIDVGSATDTLNDIIHGVDKNASLDSVVGGFVGIKKDPITAVVTNGKGEGFDGKYMIKAMALTDADVQGFKVDGNKYMVQINKCLNPQDGSAISHATNDYITFAQVNESIKKEVGSAVKVDEATSQATYSSILFTATIVDGKMTNLEYSYTFSAVLKLKIAVIPATGTGEATITGKYTDIKY